MFAIISWIVGEECNNTALAILLIPKSIHQKQLFLNEQSDLWFTPITKPLTLQGGNKPLTYHWKAIRFETKTTFIADCPKLEPVTGPALGQGQATYETISRAYLHIKY